MSRNPLAQELSPYLRQHQFNPVDWYPWGEEALARARLEDKPIFLSVGYSTCYWCHVMARESFSDQGVAKFLNEHFVSILVDREERPEIDEIYMAATRLLTHQSGWPNTVILTPDLLPWFCGTYFPPEDRPDQPSFGRMVASMAEAWRNRRDDAREQGEELVRVMGQYLEGRSPGDVPSAPEVPSATLADQALESLAATFDPEWGGFGTGSKFPMPSNLLFLEDFLGDSREAEHMLQATLEHMARGGIHDQLAGGFHRYAADREWRIPHFEKLLGDNGLLLEIYARHLERTRDPETRRVVRRTAEFLDRDLGLPGGGFASALGDGRDGAYHVWTLEELMAALGEEDCGFLAPILGFDRPPFFEESHYVLHLPRPLAEQARMRRMSPEHLENEVDGLLVRLLDARTRRRRPEVDDKVLTDWNGMAITGLAEAGRVLGDDALIERAIHGAEFIFSHLRPAGGPLRHCWHGDHGAGGQARWDAYLADYVYLTRGVLALHQATGDKRWLTAARDITTEQVERLGDPHGGFFVAAASPDLICRAKDVFDGGLPAASAMAVLNLLELAQKEGDGRWAELAMTSLGALAGAAERGDGVRMLRLAVRRYRSQTPSSQPD